MVKAVFSIQTAVKIAVIIGGQVFANQVAA